MRLGDRLGVDRVTAFETYYACLLLYSGCTTDSAEAAEIFGGDLTAHVIPTLWGSPREQVAGLLRAMPDPPLRRRPRGPSRSGGACRGRPGRTGPTSPPSARWHGCSARVSGCPPV
jgi:hypothetical protein